MKHIYLLGATGSIGQQTLDVILKHPNQFHVVGLSLGTSMTTNELILESIQPEICCLRYEKQYAYFAKKYPNITFVYGDQGLIDVASYPKEGLFVNALSGSLGLEPTVAAIKTKKTIALANKETLVMAGDLIKSLVKEYGVALYPIDSEHSALWQLIQGEDVSSVKKMVITASGGSLRYLKREELSGVTIEQALAHPNWKMGAKITIDSATMMNKGLEVIEAHHLFDLPYESIETVLHDESVIHGLVYFNDGTIKASISPSDMRIPIQYALFYPNRQPFESTFELKDMHFKPMDYDRFPLLKLAYEVGKKGGLLPTVMQAANEAAVHLFLNQKITFTDIETIVFQTVQTFNNIQHPSLELIIQTNQMIQQHVMDRYEGR